MSWHFLRELAEGSSAATSSAGAPSAPWKKSNIAERCCCEGSATACYPCSLYGTIATPSTASLGLAALISSLRDSRASPLALQASCVPEMTKKTDGPPPFASWERSGQSGHCWKMSQGYLPGLMATSVRYSESWPRSGMMRSGTVSQLQPSAHPTDATGSGYLPTPTAATYGFNQGGAMGRTGPKRYSLQAMARLNRWPTPERQQIDGAPQDRGGKLNLAWVDSVMGAVMPGASCMRRTQQSARAPAGQVVTLSGAQRIASPSGATGGKLNPAWVAWLMNWPIGWTSLEPLETDRWQQWCRSHFGR